MRIATFNANSIRTRLPAILEWLDEKQPDILAIQETKSQDKDFPAQALQDAGWHVVFAGEKSYNGVAVISKRAPDFTSFGLLDDDGLSNTRMIHVKFGSLNLINTYVPQGRAVDHEMFGFKLEWFRRLRKYFDSRLSGEDIIWVGDLNVAPEPIDVHNSKRIWGHVCHCQEVIDAFSNVCEFGFTDIFRQFIPEAENYTYWDYRVKDAVNRKIGWRIDHILSTEKVTKAAKCCAVDIEPRLREKPSDHTFLYADFEYNI